MFTAATFAELTALLGPERVRADADTLSLYARDETPRSCTPQAVLFPRSHEEVVAIVQRANAHDFPLVARGAGSGNVGGAMPVPGGVVLSFECMNAILEFDAGNRLVVVQPGVVTDDIDRLARGAGLMYAPDPGSGAYSRIGGNLATNAAGPRCVKYGATRDHVLGLRAVSGDGRELRLGSRTSKYATAYDLARLLVGSEGTLALITEATLRLIPAPETVATLRVCYASNAGACAAVRRVMQQPVVPSALEFMDRRAIDVLTLYGGEQVVNAGLPAGTQAVLMVEADGARDDVPRQIAALEKVLVGEGMLEILAGFTAADIARLWAARKSLSMAVKQIAPLKINEDVVVPISQLASLVQAIDSLGHAHAVPIVSFGHAGNGNLHVNIMVHPDDAAEIERARACHDALVETVLALGGSLSGEHGIGSEKRRYVAREIDAGTLAMLHDVKRLFDPMGILNPGKKLPD
ncbi:MAG TPA: FAD-linked oxidase C-terminal domain-containing protein [Thiobacillaceae bacterium]|nr:FAD-linked oxidase C-terminal domain-containing protein [Thiobacillaceae bacterium]HNU65251.1 FAD-linked oxidase C-terminal domain-containing protein [Thiobacillaceae bacterium]